MEIKRLWQSVRLLLIPNSKKRVEYLKKNHVFHCCGENVYIQTRRIPLYGQLIALHNNIRIASNVSFVTHDVVHSVLSNMDEQHKYQEKIGCIEIFDNVFVGANTTIMYNTRIGPNAVIAAGSVVTKDVPPGEVWGGVPARKIGDFDAVMQKRQTPEYPSELAPSGQRISPELEQYMWDKFHQAKA